MKDPTLNPHLEQLTTEHNGTYTDGQFITLNSVIEESRGVIQVGKCTVIINHTKRGSARPSMAASYWVFRSWVPGKRKLRLRLIRREQSRGRFPWHRVVWINQKEQVRWETRGFTRLPRSTWTDHAALRDALGLAAAHQILIKRRYTGSQLEMHISGVPTQYDVLENQWQAFIRLMEYVTLTD